MDTLHTNIKDMNLLPSPSSDPQHSALNIQCQDHPETASASQHAGESNGRQSLLDAYPTASHSPLCSHLTHDINAHFAQKHRSNVNCQDSMSVVRKLSSKLSLPSSEKKMNSSDEIRSRISETKDNFDQFSPCVISLSDDISDECESDKDGHDSDDERRTKRMQRSLLWIRKELMDMRKKDHIIGQQFMYIRNEIQRLRLLETVEQHRTMLDDLASDALEQKEYTSSSLCETQGSPLHPALLRDVGLTKRDIADRRFSLG